MFKLLLKYTYPLIGGLVLFSAVTSYANGDFGSPPEEVLVPRDVAKNPGSYRPRYTGGHGVFIFRGK